MVLLCLRGLLLLLMVYSHNGASSDNPKKSYEKLLKSIINVNEKRVHTMNSLNQLEDINVHSNLRTSENPRFTKYLSSSSNKEKVLLVFLNPSLTERHETESKIKLIAPRNPTEKQRWKNIPQLTDAEPWTDVDNSEEGISTEVNRNPPTAETSDSYDEELFKSLNLNKTQVNLLRSSWRKSCDKKAARLCRKACREAGKNVCSIYKCSSSIKRKIKRECHRSCKNKFELSGRISSDSSDL